MADVNAPGDLGLDAIAPEPTGGWSHSLQTLQNARLAPPHGKLELTFPASVFTAEGALVPEAETWRHNRRITLPAEPPRSVAETITGTWLWGGLLYRHFGHFLCESATRLWALDRFGSEIDGVLFFAKFADDLEPSQYHKDYARLMGCEKPLRVVAHPTEVERLIVPGQGFGLGNLARGTAPFRDAMHAKFATDIAPDGGDKLYISRSEIGPRRGGLLFETRLEAHLEAEGYEIFHPQKHPLAEQIARYKAARKVLAAEGSALHLFGMVARADQETGIIVRRVSGATRNIKRHIGSFSGRPPKLIEALNRTWMPETSRRKHLGVAELDFPRLQSRLRDEGFIGQGPQWPAFSEAEAEAEILSARFRRQLNYRPSRV